MKIIAVLLLLFFVLSANAFLRPKYNSKIVITADLPTNRISAFDLPNWITSNVYDPLFTIIDSNKVISSFCDRFYYKDKNTKFVLELNKNIKFSNNELLTPLNLINAWLHLIDLYPYKIGTAFKNVKGYTDFINGSSKIISGFKIISKNKLSISLIDADSLFHLNLAIYKIPIITFVNNSDFIGTAPLKFKLQKENKLVLNRNSYSNSSKPYLQKIIINKKKKSDFIEFQTKKTDGLAILSNKEIRYVDKYIKEPHSFYKLNSNIVFLKINKELEKEIRILLSQTINEKMIYPALVPVKGHYLEGLMDNYINKQLSVNLKILKGKTIKVIYRNDTFVKSTVDGIFVQLLRLGIKAELVEYNNKDFYKNIKLGDYDLAVESSVIDKNSFTDVLGFFSFYFDIPLSKPLDNIQLIDFERYLKKQNAFKPLFMMQEQIITKDIYNFDESLENTWKLEIK